TQLWNPVRKCFSKFFYLEKFISMEVYKNLLKEYNDKVIDNYEDWFAKDVLLDISENGGVFDSLIDEQYEFYFNLDLSQDLQIIIEILLYKSEEDEEENIHKLLIEFLKLKRITDKRILESKAYDKEYVNEYLFDGKSEKWKTFLIQLNVSHLFNNNLSSPRNQTRLDHFMLREDISKNFIKDLYSELKSKSFVNCDFDSFSKIFTQQQSTIEPISWKGTERQITYFINQLMNFLDKEVDNVKYKLIEKFFVNKKGNGFKKKQLSSVY